MTSSSEVLQMLKQKGLDKEYRFNGRALSIDGTKSYQAAELEIIKIFRFEGISNPDDMEVIYLIKAGDGAIGYFQDIYGTYAGQDGMEGRDNFIRQITEAGHDQQLSFQL